MKLRDLINRLEYLSHNGQNDNFDVCIRNAEDVDSPFSIGYAYIVQDPHYNFDEANEGPYKWIQIETFENLCDCGDYE